MFPLCTSPPMEGLGEVSIHINGAPYTPLMGFIWKIGFYVEQ